MLFINILIDLNVIKYNYIHKLYLYACQYNVFPHWTLLEERRGVPHIENKLSVLGQ